VIEVEEEFVGQKSLHFLKRKSFVVVVVDPYSKGRIKENLVFLRKFEKMGFFGGNLKEIGFLVKIEGN
jgi:hypothetical protein